MELFYGTDDQRIKSILSGGSQVQRIKYFFGDYEEITENGSTKKYYYFDSPTGLCGIFVKGSQSDTLWYAFTDHLGSLIYLVNADNSNQYLEYSYDAWGNPREVDDWTEPLAGSLFAQRGFTGHEHMTEFCLINMNGRVYDPALGRFLSPDPFVQDPVNSQSFNRYSYCLNNPLIYTDPDGEFFWIAVGIGALIGSYIGGSAAEGWQMNPTKWKWDKDTWKGVGLGAVFGAAGGAGFAYAAPALAKTAFFANFGVSGTIGAYTITGAFAGGAIGYTSGFGGGMIYSNGDWGYSHQSGIFGAKLGGSIGAAVGTVAGLLTPESRDWIAGMFDNKPSYVRFTGYSEQGFNGIPRPDVDGRLTFSEAVHWYQYGKGQNLYINLSYLDLSSVRVSDFNNPDFYKWGKPGKYINFQSNKYRTSTEQGLIYGNIGLVYFGGRNVMALPDRYDFDLHLRRGSFKRDLLTVLGLYYHGRGTPYWIIFYNWGKIGE